MFFMMLILAAIVAGIIYIVFFKNIEDRTK
jgi:hypothetical protein